MLNASNTIVKHIATTPIPVCHILFNKEPLNTLANHVNRIATLEGKRIILQRINLVAVKNTAYDSPKT